MNSIDYSELPPKPAPDSLTYESYLKINQLLDLQSVLTQPEEHDETLFIIIHQVYELWFKQILHEVQKCCHELRQDRLLPVYSSLKRIQAIQKVLVDQVSVLETMTPTDFDRFRERLNPASGFQSYQFRVLEYRLGAKNTVYLKFFEENKIATERLNQALAAPSLYQEFLGFLSRKDFNIPAEVLKVSDDTHEPNDALVETFLNIYQQPDSCYEYYMALENLLEIDENLINWRYRHVLMVERMIGNRMGTGGSPGAKYLATTLSKKIFPEIWSVRNRLTQANKGS